VIESERLVAAAEALGGRLSRGLAELAARYCSHVECTRGAGLLQALVLRKAEDAQRLLSELREAGVLLTISGGRALRFSPPLVITAAQLDEGIAKVGEVLRKLS
jgi:acetylornithine/N-succinyldiaminopimelate aminotransferase